MSAFSGSQSDDFKYAYFQKCAELKLPPNLEIINLVRKDSFGSDSLQTLNFANMRLTDQDIVPLVYALEDCRAVKNLILAHNQIKDLMIFEKFFQVNKTLEGIDLSDNPFSEESAKRLTSLLAMKTHIQWFDLTNCPTEKKTSSRTHKKSESSSHTKLTPMIPISLNNIHQRRPVPQKPKENGDRVFFRLNLYQGPQSARVRLQDPESRAEVPNFENGDIKVKKSEREDRNNKSSQQNSARTKEMFMSRVDWIIRIKDIFYNLMSNFEEKTFPKSLIMDHIREKQNAFPFISKETYNRLYFEKGYSLFQILEAIQTSEKTYQSYDDIIELICNLDKQKETAKNAPTHLIIDSTQETENFSKPGVETTKSGGTESEIMLLHMLPKQLQSKPEFVECSFSLDNNNLIESKEELQSKKIQLTKKPPRFISKNTPPNGFKRSRDESSNSTGHQNSSHPLDFRNQISSSSPTEVETARFNRGSNQPSGNKEKQESFKLEISSEISSLMDAGIRGNESLSYDIDSTFNEMNTTCKIMAALGDTPHNLSNLNLFNLALDRLSPFDHSMPSFSTSEQTPQSATLKGALKQFFGNKLYRQSEMESTDPYFGANNFISNKFISPVQKSKNLGSHLIKPNFTPTPQNNMGVQKMNEFDMVKQPSFNISKYQVQDKICEEPERWSNVDEFERVLELTKMNLKNRSDEESRRVFEMLDCFQMFPNDSYPLVSFTYEEDKMKKSCPQDNLILKRLMKHIDALKLSQVTNLNLSLQNIVSSKLKILNLSNNNLVNADFLESFKSLEFLNLSNNRLKVLPVLGNCLQLKEVYLSYNKFTELPNFFGFDEIVVISASFNLINSLETIANLTLNRKLHVLDLTGNPITKKANYQNILRNILPQIQAIDVSGENFSEFLPYKNICFTQIPKLQTQVKGTSSATKAGAKKLELPRKKDIMSHGGFTAPETERNKDSSPVVIKKTKNQIPKLNMHTLQSLELSSIKSGSSVEPGSSKLESYIPEPLTAVVEAKGSIERPQEAPRQVISEYYQTPQKKEVQTKRLGRDFLSSREHISNVPIKKSNSPGQKNSVNGLRKPVRIIHTAKGEENKKDENKMSKLKERPILGDSIISESFKINIKKNISRQIDENQKENVNILNRDNAKSIPKTLRLGTGKW